MTALVALSGCVVESPPKPEDYRPQAMPAVVLPEEWVAGDKEAGPVAGQAPREQEKEQDRRSDQYPLLPGEEG